MDRVVLNHLTGSKAHQVEEWPVDGFGDVLIGRDPSARLRYDADRDDLVGRHHARLVQDPSDRLRFTLLDLNSRNGTYVNGQRIAGPVALSPGDVVQLGPGGPEFQFAIERDAAKNGAEAPAEARATRVSGDPVVGKQTVERLVADAQRRTRRGFYLAFAVFGVAVAAAIGVGVYRAAVRNRTLTGELAAVEQAQQGRMSAAEIARRYSGSVVFVEVGWQLILTQTGEQLYHEYYVPTDKAGNPVADSAGDVIATPVYVQLPDGHIEPSLALDRGTYGQNQPIGGRLSGSGFVVTPDGFILTNRHVAAPWETTYAAFPPGPGRLVKLATKEVGRIESPPRDWVPATARVLGRRSAIGKNVDGRFDYLDVTFARTRLRVPAKLVRISDRHDVAMLKIDVPQRISAVPIAPDADVKAGTPITILGYPAISPTVTATVKSEDPFNREAQRRSMPDPTVTDGVVGRVVAAESAGTADADAFGDSYQMTANAVGAGNSGGPVFDDRGRVIGIFYASRQAADARVTFAVPIKYGVELMQIGR